MTSSITIPQVHKNFAATDADFHIYSTDNVIFKVHSHTLGNVSTFFDPFLSMPQPSDTTADIQTIYLDESADILELLFGVGFGLFSGYDSAYRASLDLVEDVLRAADKYEIRAVKDYFRKLFIMAVVNEGFPNKTYSDPLRLYVICRRSEWHAEAERAFSRTLNIDIFNEKYINSMRRLNPSDLVDMMLLRKKRKDEMKAILEDPNDFGFIMSITNFPTWTCTMCYSRYTTMPILMAWRDVVDQVLKEIDHCPSGASLGLSMDQPISPIHPLLRSLFKLWSCGKCGKALYEIERVLQGLQRAVNRLPTKCE